LAFNGSGTFNRVHSWTTDKSNAVAVTASRMDAEHDGFATGLTNCITKDGQSTTTARIGFALGVSSLAGSTSAVSYSFANDANTGVYSPAADQVALVAGGTAGLTVSATGVTLALPILAPAGTVGAPGLSFSDDTDCGLYRIGANNVGLAVNGANVLDIGTTGLAVTGLGSFTTTLSATGNFAINTNKFNVTAASGNTAIAGTLAVTGATTLSAALTVSTGGAAITGNSSVTGTFAASSTLSGAAAGGNMVATQAEVITGTAVDKLLTPGRQHYHISAAKAWARVTYSGGTPALTDSYNVSGITDNGAGDLTVTFATAMTNATYTTVVTPIGPDNRIVMVDTLATGSVRMKFANLSGAADDPGGASIAVFGD
jgi:hypothetical protein